MTKSLIIDASFTFKLILPGLHQTRCKLLMTQWEEAGHTLYVPTLWLYEITSALSKTVHFGVLTSTEGHRALQLAQKLNLQSIHPDDNLTRSAFDWTLQLKRAAAYDSFYLALAETLPAEFWTADKRLYNAVDANWIHYIGD